MERNGRELAWDGCVNVRDLGGLGQIRPGAVVRMEAPRRLSCGRVGGGLGARVRTVVDLRNADEGEPDRAPRPAAITTVHVPQDPVGTPFYEHWAEIDSLSSPLYFPAMLAEYPERVVAAVRAIANAAPGCVVFHCAGGKDRTGLLALVLLTLAGAATDEIIADYLLTYDRMKQRYDEIGVPRPAHRCERVAGEPRHHHRSIADLDDRISDDAGFPPRQRPVRHRTRRAAHPPDYLTT